MAVRGIDTATAALQIGQQGGAKVRRRPRATSAVESLNLASASHHSLTGSGWRRRSMSLSHIAITDEV